MADHLLAVATAERAELNSVVPVNIDDLVCSLSLVENAFGDTLPIIPASSAVSQGKVLFRQTLKASVVRTGGGPAVKQVLTFQSDRTGDQLPASVTTDARGEATFTLESREAGSRTLTLRTPGITHVPLTVSMTEAWYERRFRITHYNVAAEGDFGGELVPAAGLPIGARHRYDFLFGARGLPMQGTGVTTTGSYIRYTGGGNGWLRNTRGNPVRLNAPETATFVYTDGIHGRFGRLTDNASLAVDPSVIPARSVVEISTDDGVRSLGERSADDTGGGVRGSHIDVFVGAGNAANTVWAQAGGDFDNARVKFKR
ncbi:3D domain-containing protein [Pseudomonas chlororaphis subsp. aureofaciens]|uniref:3D domain-containing protein n=1 Tax=Pseudomonas chlororaphis TaxID=587753 RepID=UPI00355724E3